LRRAEQCRFFAFRRFGMEVFYVFDNHIAA
jgi:hypothetical protein